jgi:eukaryotic-like serine/threonine-protein kinase
VKPGTVINKRYKVISIVGRGGMGTVLRVRRLSDNAIVALKYCHLKDPQAVRRFAREIRAMKEFSHPHVVPVYSTNLKHDPPYFVMPFAEGSCAAKLSEYATDETSAVDAFLEICQGIQAIHNAGLVHRDIKPDNALILDGCIVVSDLGLVKPMSRDTTILTETMMIVGTEMYLAPEQRLPGGSRDADHRTDLYQLGKTLYQLLTGRDPVLMDMGCVPSGLAHVIRKATREHPDDRYQSIGELIDAIHAYVAACDPSARPIAAFEAVINRIKERLERGEYKLKDLQQLIAILMLPAVQAAADQFLELFDQIPKAVLEVLAESHSDDLIPVLQAYVGAIEQNVGERTYAYAEKVAKKMQIVVSATGASPDIKGLCMEATLIAAVNRWRFAAMNVFNSMLVTIDDDGDAMAVREALARREKQYARICDQVPSISLHPTIRAIRDRLVSEEK